MSILGLDVSTSKIAIATLSLDGYNVVELTSKLKSWEARLKELYTQLLPWVAESSDPD